MFQDVRLGLDSILLDPGPRGLAKNGVGCRLHPKEETVIASMFFLQKIIEKTVRITNITK